MPKYNWFYHSEPESHLGGRRMHTPRGKVLGGSSSINGLVYVRGNPRDFERWEEEGAAGWSYARRAAVFPPRGARRLRRRRLSRRCGTARHALRHARESAARGVARGGGAGRLPADERHQRRAAGGVRPHGHDRRERQAGERLERVSAPRDDAGESDRAHARDGDPDPVRRQAGHRRRVQPRRQDANREHPARVDPVRRADQFPAAAETVGRSGRRRSCGSTAIPVVHDLPGVGENLQDHLEFYFQVACTEPVTLYPSVIF